MNLQRAAEIQVVLEGVRLPATRAELVRYAAQQDFGAAVELGRIPDRVYARIDAVGEELVPTQPHAAGHGPLPRPESGALPGHEDYLNPSPAPGAIRPRE